MYRPNLDGPPPPTPDRRLDHVGKCPNWAAEAFKNARRAWETSLPSVVAHVRADRLPVARNAWGIERRLLCRPTEPIDREVSIAAEGLANEQPFPVVDVVKGR